MSPPSTSRPSPRPQLQHFWRRPWVLVACALASLLAYACTSHLAIIPSTLLSSLALAGGASCSGRLQLRAPLLASALGGVGGAVVGTAIVLSRKALDTVPEANLGQRATMLAMLALAGLVGGLVLGANASRADRRPPRDVLRSISALTTGIFAMLVMIVFVHSGLDRARTFSSRLSTSLTILVAAVVLPGWLASRFAPSRFAPSRLSPRRPSPDRSP